MTASLLRAASFNLSPSAIRSLCPPPPLIPPVRWAPGLLLHDPRRLPSGTHPHSSGHQRSELLLALYIPICLATCHQS
jgi:hypothetical protein